MCTQGTSGQGKRTASVLAHYTPAGGVAGPYAAYSKGEVNLQSAAQEITDMSVYSEQCIDRKASQTTIRGIEWASGRPAAAHSMLWVLDGKSCDAGTSVHAPEKKQPSPDYVDADFPYDTDQAGGPVAMDSDASGKSVFLLASWSGSTRECKRDHGTDPASAYYSPRPLKTSVHHGEFRTC